MNADGTNNMLTIDNPDWQAVREGFGDETVDFWDLPNIVEHFYSVDADEPEAKELAALVEDYFRVNRQCRQMCELVPAAAAKYQSQCADAVNIIERNVKRLLGSRVALIPNGPLVPV